MGCGGSVPAQGAGGDVAPLNERIGGGKAGTQFFIYDKGQTKKITEDYVMPKKARLGEGSYGTVTKATSKHSDKIVAIKTIAKANISQSDRFKQEIDIMKVLDHPNIIKLFETYEDHRNIYLVMELCDGGELFDRIIDSGHFTEQQAAYCMLQILRGVYYMHENGLMHRDLKPENFLFSAKGQPIEKSTLKIIDFGLSRKIASVATTRAGTPYYVAPQVLSGKYDEKCDIWSCGVIAYVLLCGYPPFHGDNDQAVLNAVKKGQFAFNPTDWKGISSEAKDIISQMLTMQPAKRVSAQKVINHAWLVNKGTTKTKEKGDLGKSICSSLKKFRNKNTFHKKALVACARMCDDDKIKELKNFFLKIDKDGNGTLTAQEIREGFKESDVPDDFQAIIEKLDTDGSGQIEYTEWIAATLNMRDHMKEDVLWQAFRLFDTDNSGKISEAELEMVLKSDELAGETSLLDDQNIKEILKEVDTNGDGEIDFEEFKAMMGRDGS